jgi:DNA-binding transcriptional ArsR family regulator
MELPHAAGCFAELGHPTRLAILLALVKIGPEGIRMGELGKLIKVPNSTLTHHICNLENVGLLCRRQEGKKLMCIGNFELIKELSDFLLESCCASSKKKCGLS